MPSGSRQLTAVLVVSTVRERMGDYAYGFARITHHVGEQPRLKPPTGLATMAEIGVDMLHKALEAFVTGKVELARSVPKQDDEVDALFNKVQREILDQMIADPEGIDQINHLLWACHNLERLADRVINICERTAYIATGEMREFDVSDDEKWAAS